MTRKSRLAAACLVVLAFAAGSVVIASTPWGLGFEYDSVFYWSAADNLLEGRGLVRIDGGGEPVPLTHFPPLYPVLLAASAGLAGIEVVAAARWLSAVLLALNVALIGLVTLKYASSWGLSLAAALMLLLSPVILERHLWAMSEPLYFAFQVATLAVLAKALNRERISWLIAAGLIAGLATLTRYAGIALTAAGSIAVVALGTGPVGQRFRRAVLFLLVASLPLALWQARNRMVAGSLTNREFIVHPISLEQLKQAGATLASWVPYGWLSVEVRLAVGAGVGLVAVILLASRRTIGEKVGRGSSSLHYMLARLAGLFGAAYLGFLGVSLSFFDASTRLGDRILSPLFLAGMLAIVGLVAGRLPVARWPTRLALLLAFLALAAPYASRSLRLSALSSNEGLGFASREWRDSETMKLVLALDEGTVMYSNEAFPIYFLTGRPAYWVPELVDPVKGKTRSDFDRQLELMRSRLDDGAVLVIFHPESLGPELPSLQVLVQGLEAISIAEDGAIYRVAAPSA